MVGNSKSEAPNPKQIRNPKLKIQNEFANDFERNPECRWCFEFRILTFAFVSDLGFRNSDLVIAHYVHS